MNRRACALVALAIVPLAFAACLHDWGQLRPESGASGGGGSSSSGTPVTTVSGTGGGTTTTGTTGGGTGSTTVSSTAASTTSSTGPGGSCSPSDPGVCCANDACAPNVPRCCETGSSLACQAATCPSAHNFTCDANSDCNGSHVCCAHWDHTAGDYGDVRCVTGACVPPTAPNAMDGEYQVCDTQNDTCVTGTCTPEPKFGGRHGVCK
jgi:hypothetical protein